MSDKLAIAVDFGGTSIKIGVTRGAELVDKAAPLGLGRPGWVDFYKGVLYQLTNVPVWNHRVPVREVMERDLRNAEAEAARLLPTRIFWQRYGKRTATGTSPSSLPVRTTSNTM